MKRGALIALALGLMAACQPEIPSGVYVCSFDGDCPPEMSCEAGRCVRGCVPEACPPPTCGEIADGCGGTVDCGGCVGEFDTCGAVFENLCGCQALAECGELCGSVPDGCGRVLDCGLCAAGQQCDPEQNLCVGCVAPTCGTQTCGQLADPCGGPSVTCPYECVGVQVCGPENTCVDDCTPNPTTCDARECGGVSNGCGGLVDCGGCDTQQNCNQGACECRLTCDSEGAECGRLPVDGCEDLECGACPGPQVCVANRCGCMPDANEPNDRPAIATEVDAALLTAVLGGVSDEEDHDWYRFQRSDTGVQPGGKISVELAGGPGSESDNYDLEAFALCTMVGAFCGNGETPVNGPEGGQRGCVSRQPGTIESVELNFGCAIEEVLVHVIPRVAESCVPYNLTVEFVSDGPTPG